jgi:hypothetical protein
MSPLTEDTLRLQLAEFNTFVIEQYVSLGDTCIEQEPKKFLFGAFCSMSRGLASIGKVISLPSISNTRDLSIIKDSLQESYIATFLIEMSAGIGELTEEINKINAVQIVSILDDIERYGLEYRKLREEINEEIAQVKCDYKDYFNNDGSFKNFGVSANFEQAANFLEERSGLAYVKKAFTNGKNSYHYFSSMVLDVLNGKAVGKSDKLLKNVLDALTIILIALSHIEPFLEVHLAQTSIFQNFIKRISVTKTNLQRCL